MDLVSWGPGERDAFIDQQFEAQERDYRGRYPPEAFLVVERGGTAIGRLYRWAGATDLNLIDIALLPEFRNQGIGTALIRVLMAEADADGVAMTLYVERFNPALRLYARLGFQLVEDQGIYLSLRRPPSATELS